MRTQNSPTLAVAAACAIFLATGCASAPSGSAAKTEPVKLSFELTAGETPFKCGDIVSGIGTAGATMSLQDARIFVSNFRLVSADGAETPVTLDQDGVWQSGNLALLDFEDASGSCNGNPALNTSVQGTAPPGAYTGIVFDLGVPTEMNHQDPTLAAAPLNQSSLSWPWRYGYRHTTIDLETAPQEGLTATASGFSIHLGAMNCGEGAMRVPPEVPCEKQNRAEIRVEAFNPATQSLAIDLAALLQDTDITTNDPDTASGCMSAEDDADCIGIFAHTGLSDGRQDFVRAK
jgi:uncharacterized repeat protein (TIGR04052 family)